MTFRKLLFVLLACVSVPVFGQTVIKVAPGESVTVLAVEAPPPSPTCSTPKPADITRSQTCPAGTTGIWKQTASSTAAPYPTCWTVGAFAPSSPPAGACTTVPPDPTPATGIPLSFDDAAFANAKTSGAMSLGSGQSRSNLSIVSSSGDQVITCTGSCTLDHIRIQGREGVRCVSGAINLTWMWIEVKGVGSDHADGLQCYSPGSTGSVTVKNSTFKATNANAAYFSADNWKGSHSFENVLFWGGNFGLRIPADGGSTVSLKNVYFVKGSFQYGAYLFDVVSGKQVQITQWENVRYVSIVNGALVLGELIPKP